MELTTPSWLANRYVAGAAMLLLALAAMYLYGRRQCGRGVSDTEAAAMLQQLPIEHGMQYEKDRADANYRDAVLARQAAQEDVAAVRARLVTGCCASMTTTPRLPQPAADLM